MDTEDPILGLTAIIVVCCCCAGCVGYSLFQTYRPRPPVDTLLEDIV